MSGGNDNSKYFGSILLKHENGIMPRTYADKQGLRLGLDQNIGSKIVFSLGGDILHNVNDRGLSNNENNGSPPQAAYSSMPSFIDYRGQCPDGSRVSDPGNPCANAVYPSTAPYAFSNPFQTVALLLNKEVVSRSIMTGHLDYNVLTTRKHASALGERRRRHLHAEEFGLLATRNAVRADARHSRYVGDRIRSEPELQREWQRRLDVQHERRLEGDDPRGVQYETGDFDRNNTWPTIWSAVSTTCRAGPSSPCSSIANTRAGSGSSPRRSS
jgi:hypothetical protein